MLKIYLSNYGIANRQGDNIFINRRFLEVPDLYDALIFHETEHTSGFSIKDILIDIKITHLKGLKLKYYKFILTHPSTWVEFSPLWFYKGHLSINPLLLCLYGVLALLTGVIGWHWIG